MLDGHYMELPKYFTARLARLGLELSEVTEEVLKAGLAHAEARHIAFSSKDTGEIRQSIHAIGDTRRRLTEAVDKFREMLSNMEGP
jgi:hypothetical protein